jgi:hypothetical protein
MSVEQLLEWVARETEVHGENCISAALSTSKHTWPDLGSNPGHRKGKPVTNHLSYDTAFLTSVTSKGPNTVGVIPPLSPPEDGNI